MPKKIACQCNGLGFVSCAHSFQSVSVIQDSMANAQSEPPPADMDLDETTFVTLVTVDSRHQSPNGTPGGSAPVSLQTSGGVRFSQTQGQDGDDEHSETPVVPSPSFSGFHSIQSSPDRRLGAGFNGAMEESNLDGHTLVGEPPSVLVDTPNQDISALSFWSANQSISENAPESHQHDRQVVDEPLLGPNGGTGSGPDSLLSVVHNPDRQSSSKSSPARSVIADSQSAQKDEAASVPQAWDEFMAMLKSGQSSRENTDQEKDDPEHGVQPGEEDHDSPLHSEQGLHLSPDLSPPESSSHSRNPPTSGQQEPPSQKSSRWFGSNLPRATRPVPFLPSQMSEIIDLTDSPGPTASSQEQPERASKATDGEDSKSPLRKNLPSSSKVQYMTEVSVSPQTPKKKSKRRSWRRF